MSCTFPGITIWSPRAYGCSLFQFLLHLRLHSYISLTPFFENNLSPYLFHILLEPAFVCSCRDLSSTHTAAAASTTTTTVPKGREGGGLHRPSMISPLRNSLNPPSLPPSLHFYSQYFLRLWFPERCFIVPVRKSLLNDSGKKRSMKNGKDKLDFSLCLSAHLSVRTPRHLSLILPPSLSLHHPLSGGG